VDSSWIATPNGLARVKTLKKGDKLVSYNFNATSSEEVLIESSVTKWDVQFPKTQNGRDYKNVYPGGKVR
jgi:hypothetical protein